MYIRFGAQKFKNMSGFNAISHDPWSLTFHLLEMLWLDLSIPFGGYKSSHIQSLRGIHHIESKDTLEKFHLKLSLHPFVLESLNFLCSVPKIFLSWDGELHWLLLLVSLPLWRIEVVEAQLEGLSFLVLLCVISEVCHLCSSVDYINRNTLFSSIRYIANICIYFHGCIWYVC